MPQSSLRHLSSLLFLFTFALLAGCLSGSSSDSPTGIETGYVLYEGYLLEGPYRIEAAGTEVSINGRETLSFAAPRPRSR